MSEDKQMLPIDESIKDLSMNISGLIDQSNRFLKIFSRAGSDDNKSLVQFSTIGDKELDQIVEKMPMINEGTKAFGKQNSQVSGRLMSLTMIATSPYHRMKQCLAKIERKRSALKENIFRLRREKVELDRLASRRNRLSKAIADAQSKKHLELTVTDTTADTSSGNPIDDKLQDQIWGLQLLEIDIEEKVANISDSNIYVEAALKEIGHYQTAYEQIMKNNNIPEDWDEKLFEESEVEEHIKMAFLHGVRDIMMTGRLNVGTIEYLEQFGVHPVTALSIIQGYLQDIDSRMKQKEVPDINHLYSFLDSVYKTFKNEYKKTLDHMGLDSLLDVDFLYKSTSKED